MYHFLHVFNWKSNKQINRSLSTYYDYVNNYYYIMIRHLSIKVSYI